MVIVTFYTPEYEHYLSGWLASMGDRKTCAYARHSRGTWRDNVGHKPDVIVKALEEWKQPIFWLDVDAAIIGPCPLLDELPDLCDFAVYSQSVHALGTARGSPGGTKAKNAQLLSGSLFFNNTWGAILFAKRWRAREAGQYMSGQVVLGETFWYDRPPFLRTHMLPEEYCKIAKFDYKTGTGPDQIRHASASVEGGRAAAGVFTKEQRVQERRRRCGVMHG